MAKIYTLVLIYFILPLTVSAQSTKSNKWGSRIVQTDNDLLMTTTWLYSSNGSNLSGFATGYYFNYKDDIYIITNKHVIDGMTILGFDISRNFASGFFIDSLQFRTRTFFSINEDYVDLAAIKISNINYLNLDSFKNWRAFSIQNLPTKKDIANFSLFDEKIIALSYPGSITSPYPKYPLIYYGGFSTPYDNQEPRFGNKFMINSSITTGCSGSPVISIKGKGKYFLLGTYYMNLYKYEQIDSVETENIKTNGGIIKVQEINSGVRSKTLENFRTIKERYINIAFKSDLIITLLERK